MEIPHLLKQIRNQGIEVKLSGDNLELIFHTEEINDLAVEQIKAHKEEIVGYLKSISTNEELIKDIPIVSSQKDYPVTSSQFRFWILCQLEDINKAYNMPLVLRIEGVPNNDLLEKAFQELTQRHEILRTGFLQGEKGELRQYIIPKKDFEYKVTVFDEVVKDKVNDLIVERLELPFDLSQAPLLRTDVLIVSERESYLCFNIHHIISDGISLGIISKELNVLYNNLINEQLNSLPELKIQYKDYTQWINKNKETEKSEEYWLSRFQGDIPVLDLQAYQLRPKAKTYEGDVYTHIFNETTLTNLKEFSIENKGTLFMSIMAALNGVLFRYTNQTDLILGTPVSGRNHPDLEHQIGLYINTLPVRTIFDSGITFMELALLQKKILSDAYKYADYPFGDLVDNLNITRDFSRSPLFDILVTHQQNDTDHTSQDQTNLSDLQCNMYKGYNHTVSKYDITFAFLESEKELTLKLEYNINLYQRDFIERLCNNLEEFIKNSIETPEKPIEEIRCITSDQELEILNLFNNTYLEYDKEQTFLDLFVNQANTNPDNIALICQGIKISYGELDNRATQLAIQLKNEGIRPGDSVGICLGRSIEMIVGILGILKSGALYLPLDPFYPLERIDYIIEDSETKFVVADQYTKEFVSEKVQVIDIEILSNKNQILINDCLPSIDPDSVAYMIYTSGSTGKPKGVKVLHKNLTNFFQGMNQKFENNNDRDIWLGVTSISFDISILELLWTLSRGNNIVIQLEKPVPLQAKTQMDFSFFYFPTGDNEESHKYKLLIEGAKYADENGFKAIWVPERHFHSFGDQFPNPSVAAAAVSTITNNVKLRSGSVVLPLHDPVRVAEEWSMVDNLSEGRVEVSIASGWHPNDFVLAPENFENRHQVMKNKLETLTNLWQGDSLTRKNGVGKDFTFTIHPKPVQKKLPIWITAAGGEETFRYAGSIGANVLTHLMRHSITDLKEKIKIYREALTANGFDPKQGKVALMLHTFVSEDSDYVKKTVETPFKNYLKNSVNLLTPMAEEANLDVNNDMDKLLEMAFLRYYKTSSLFGTPESCMKIINELYDIGVNEIACLLDFGIDKDAVLSNLKYLRKLKEAIKRRAKQQDYISEKMKLLTQEESTEYLIKKYGITHMQSTPSFYEEMIDSELGKEALKKVKNILVGGEALSVSLADKLLKIRNKSFYNMYGPTETTIWSAYKKIDASENVTIGTPIANTGIYILDSNNNLCPVGVPGELCIGGDGVSLGYKGRKKLTAEKFIDNPFSKGQKMYKTGDVARWMPNGEIDFLGRLDRQIKLKGYRIELSEIERVIADIPEVDQNIVSVLEIRNQPRLVAYLKTNIFREAKEVKDYLRIKLPDFMIPQEIIMVDKFPLTPNGKIDVNKLPNLFTNQGTERKYIAPENELQSQLSEIWSSFLKLEKISIDDNFFEIGGNSMKAFQLLAIVNSSLNLDLQIVSFFQYPTIRLFAESINNCKDEKRELLEDEMEDVDDLIDFMTDI